MEPWLIAIITVAGILVLIAVLTALLYFKLCPKLVNAFLLSVPPDRRAFHPDEAVPRPNTEDYLRRDEWYLHEANRESVVLKADDGVMLAGNIIASSEHTHRWVIAMHGFRIDAREMSEFLYRFHEAGYNVLAPDQRAHGLSGGSYTTMGALERYDLLRWITFLTERDPQAQIILFGGSMGAATVLLATGLDLPSNIKAAIADSAFASAEYMVAAFFRLKKIPKFPLYPLLLHCAAKRCGADLRKADVVKAVQKSHTPTLFLHGDQDRVVPFSMLETLFTAAACTKQKHVCIGAQHTQGYTADPQDYWNAVLAFAEEYINHSVTTL